MLRWIRSVVIRLVENPEQRNADGVPLGTLIALPVTAAFAAVMYRGLTRAATAAYLDRKMLEALFFFQIFMFASLLCILAASQVARRRWPDSPLLAYGLVQVFAAAFGFYSYYLGAFTSPIVALGLFVLASTGLLFEARVILAGLASLVAIVLATTVAEQLGAIRYAPLFVRPPFEAGQLSPQWLISGGSLLMGVLFSAFVFLVLAQVGRNRELRLRRATDLIRRYVPAQLAKRILAGEHTGTGQPERRKVTLFFSDVVGFTEASDRMEAEDLAALLNMYLSEMATIADSYGATVNQFVGDGIMIFFGAPEATNDQDHAIRAVLMARAMQRRMAELQKNWFASGIQTPFRIRIGINTGVASVGDFGSEGRTSYSAVGNQTNLTARIQDHCVPGEVLISHTTWALVKNQIRCEERGEIEVKGIHYPVRVYEVAEESSAERGDA